MSLGDKEPGSVYEAHERLKTAYYRSRSKKACGDGYDICVYGALLHFKKGEYQCGMELATMMLDAYKDDREEYSSASRQRVMLLVSQYPKVAGSAEEQYVSGMQQLKHRALAWLNTLSKDDVVIEELKRILYLKAGLYTSDVLGWEGLGMALPDMIRAGDIDRLYDDVLEKSLSRASPQEQDAIIARTMLHILEYIPLERKRDAYTMACRLYDRFCSCRGNTVAGSAAECVYYLVLAFQRQGSVDLVNACIQVFADRDLCAQDPSLVELCRHGLLPKYCPQRGGSDPLSSMLQGLFQHA